VTGGIFPLFWINFSFQPFNSLKFNTISHFVKNEGKDSTELI
jgi:hypothetical protein